MRSALLASNGGGFTSLFVLATLFSAAACSEVDAPAKKPAPGVVAYYQSGSRLRARLLDAGGGAVRFVGWRDTTLGLDCTVRATDHGYRCVPDGETRAPSFSDAACTEPAWIAASPPQGIVVVKSSKCVGDDVYQVFRAGAAVGTSAYALSTPMVTSETCLPDPTQVGTAYALVSADAELEPMTTSVSALGALDAVFAVGQDGSRQLVELRDHARGIPCVEARGPGNGVDRCFAADAQYDVDSYFTSPDCSGANGGVWSCQEATCPLPSFGLRTEGASCAPTLSFFALGAPRAAFSVQNGTCAAITYGPCEFSPNATPVAPDALPELAHATIGTGRVKVDTLTPGGSTSVLGYGSFTDAISKLPCAELVVAGTSRCVPSWVDLDASEKWFADPACVKPVAHPLPGNCVEPSVALRKESNGSLGIYSLFPLSTQQTYGVVKTVCSPLAMAPVYEIDALVDPATFATLTPTTE